MSDLQIGEHDLLAHLKPDTWIGAIAYLLMAILLAMLSSRALRAAVHAALTRSGHIDRTTISFLQQFGTALIWVGTLIIYADLIPVLRWWARHCWPAQASRPWSSASRRRARWAT